MQMTPAEYNAYVTRLSPKSPLWKDCLNAFWIGGLICVIGQLIGDGIKLLDWGEDQTAAGQLRCDDLSGRAVYRPQSL